MKAIDIRQKRLLKEASKLIDTLEFELKFIVESIKSKKAKKAA